MRSRLASRILLRLARAPYRNEDDIYAAAHALPWRRWFRVEKSIRVDVAAVRSPLRSLDFATLRIKDAVCDRFRADCGARPDVDTASPAVRIHAFLDANTVSLYLDTSGEPLWRRGYRREAGEAPLKENLAAGLIALSGWNRREPFLDPMCGGGTLLIEAAMMALDIPPGRGRHFAFERLENFDAALWREVRKEAQPQRPRRLAVFGRDRDPRALSRARANLAAAGLSDCVVLEQADILCAPAPAAHGVLVANPPYGRRLEEAQALAELYPKLGDALKKRYAGWRCYLFSGDPRLPRLIRLRATRRTPLYNGAIECRLYEYRIVAGRLAPRSGPDPADRPAGH